MNTHYKRAHGSDKKDSSIEEEEMMENEKDTYESINVAVEENHMVLTHS